MSSELTVTDFQDCSPRADFHHYVPAPNFNCATGDDRIRKPRGPIRMVKQNLQVRMNIAPTQTDGALVKCGLQGH
jgi:hypothetical protein